MGATRDYTGIGNMGGEFSLGNGNESLREIPFDFIISKNISLKYDQIYENVQASP